VKEKKVEVMKLDGKVALVTGAAQGIGEATARVLGEEGAYVIAADINGDKVSQNVEYMKQKGYQAEMMQIDVSSINDVHRSIDKIVQTHQRIDILINIAGIFSKTPILEITEDEWDKIFSVNLKGTFFLSKEVLVTMIKNKYGKIVNVASLSAKRGGVTSGIHYGASKAGVISVTKYLAKFSAPYNININAVVPGFVDTPMFRRNVDSKENVIKAIPIGRIARPVEVAKAIVFLASDDASYITGEILDVNGGILMD